MASYQQDFSLDNLKNIIDKWDGSEARQKMTDARKYYLGENPTILKFRRMYWSDEKKQMTENKFVANYKIGYNKFHDIVSQKVSTLLDEAPVLESGFKDEGFVKQLGYKLKTAGTEASLSGTAFMFFGYDDSISVFKTCNCIPFYDDTDQTKIKAFIRYYDVIGMMDGIKTRYAEVYQDGGMSVYKSYDCGNFELKEPMKAYKSAVRSDMFGTEAEPISGYGIPIVEFKNNDSRASDLTSTIRAKIDVIDIVNSGFANNIEDFGDIFWVIKNGAGMSTDEFEDFVASINRTKKVVLSGDSTKSLDVDTKQISIPTEARNAITTELIKELTDESGIIDTAALTGSSLTTTAIKAASMKLRQRVSDFEWYAFSATESLLTLYDINNGLEPIEHTVDFTKLLIDNDKEIIENAVLVKGTISNRSYLTLLKRANLIQNVDEEIAMMSAEGVEKYTISEPDTEAETDTDTGDDNEAEQNINSQTEGTK